MPSSAHSGKGRGPAALGHRARFACAITAGLLLLATPGPAQEAAGEPPRIEFAFPLEFDYDFGAANGNAIIGRFLPLVGFPLGEKWRLVNLSIAIVADAPGGVPGSPGNPEPVPGPRVFGLGDLSDLVFFTPPTRSNKLVWGFGPAFTFPIATDDRLGSGKWSAGPALRITYRPGRWNLGAVMANLRSYAGDAERDDVHQLLVRGLIRRQLGGGWYFTSSPIITANWNASSGQRWLVPVGGGLGKRFKLGSRPVALSVQAYANAVKPEGAPDGSLRVNLVLTVPRSVRR